MRKFVLTAASAALALTLSTGGELSGVSLNAPAFAQSNQQSANLSQPQLQSLVSSIALYPDSLLSQMLMAATYPLEVAEAANWLRSNQQLKGTQLENALKPQTWDNSVKSLISFPEALNMLGNKLDWTQQLGNAYLAQPKDLMQAVQTLRAKAKQAGNLQSNQQVQVSTEQSNIIIVPANPQVIYVPTYNPTVVYGAWPYPAYPPYPAYNPAWGSMAFGAGLAVGAALWSTPHWGSGSITINNNNFNNFNRNYNSVNNMASNRLGDTNNWNHNPAHRDGVPYNNAGLNNRFGDANRSGIDNNNFARQQSAANDWKNNASPEDKQRAQQARTNAQNTFNRDASPEQKQKATQDRSNMQQDRSNQDRSSADRSSSDRSSSDRSSGGDRSGGERSFGGGSRGGFGGGHFGGFRR